MATYSFRSIARVVAVLVIWALVLGGIVWAAGRAHAGVDGGHQVSAIQLRTQDRDRLRDATCIAGRGIMQRDRDCDQLGTQSGTTRRTRTRAKA